MMTYKVYKPSDEDKDEFIERISSGIEQYVFHTITPDKSVTLLWDDTHELLKVKTLKLNEHAN